MIWMHKAARFLRGEQANASGNNALDRLTRLSQRARDAVPANDMIQPRFDVEIATPARELLVILSTQRSGSTLLCEQLAALDYCYAHEYFQPWQYLPMLVESWGAADGNAIVWARFAAALRQRRTAATGVLAINLHGDHLAHFARAAPHLADLPVRYVHVTRRDIIGQALSYSEAHQSGKWSSHYASRGEPEYSFDATCRAISSIQRQNVRIAAFLCARSASAQSVVYEDFCADPLPTLRHITGLAEPVVRAELARERPTATQRQADGSERVRRRERFAREFLSAPGGPRTGNGYG